MGKILAIVGAAVVAILLVLGGMMVSGYNSLVGKQEEVRNKWSGVETQLQRRVDLIGNLVGAVQGALKQEQAVFGDIANARAGLTSALGRKDRQAAIAADNDLTSAISRLNFLNIVEQYPELKSNDNILRLQDELAGTENRVAVARQDYNTAVKNYNLARRSFPTVLVAGMLGFSEETVYFEAAPGSREAPKVQL
jgi:LemA protein